MDKSKYLVSLSTDDENTLLDIFNRLKYSGANVVAFKEPDIGDQCTAICYYGTPELMKLTKKLDLALKN